MRPFDIERYAGEWHEIKRLDHRFERGLTNVTATYTVLDDGTLEVVNRGFDRAECEWQEAEGRAHFQRDQDVASLSVTFFWPFYGGYHVIALDQENYQWSLVSGPTRDYLWILARTPNPPEQTIERLVAQAATLEFDVDALIDVDHSSPECVAEQ